MDIPETQWIVEKLIPVGAAMLWSAREKAGKGILCIDVAVSIASEQTFIGKAISTPGPVVYMALEESIGLVRERLKLRAGTAKDIPVFVLQADGSREGQEFTLEDPECIKGLIEMIRKIRPVAVFIDTLREAHSGKEDSSDDMAPRLRPIKAIAHQTRTTIIFTHHHSKGGGFRGSTAILGSLDDGLEFVRTDDDRDPTVTGYISGKGRHINKVYETIKFDPETGRWGESNPIITSIDLSLRDRVLGSLRGEVDGLTSKEITARETADGIRPTSLKTVQNLISSLIAEQVITPIGTATRNNARRYVLTNPEMDLKVDLIPNDSRNKPGTNKVTPIRQCVDCGAPVRTSGDLYCPKHGGLLEPTGTGGDEWMTF
jgi:hypothetical protein